MNWHLLVAVMIAVASRVTALIDQLPPIEDNEGGKLWVVLAAGSDGYFNYRHQADVCHAYQIVKKHGVPDERIIVFMRDDIANNTENPHKGVIVNRPGGPNVYPGVPKDYTGDNLRWDLFLNVVQGKEVSDGSGKTVKSGPNDRIFIYFADHGAVGLVQFGDDTLKATDLNKAIQAATYRHMVLYWESCESGSMFKNLLPSDGNVFATSASSPSQSSYACYFDKDLSTYVGDCYSVNWMEDADKEDLTSESLQKQYNIVKEETNTSQVMEWGNKKLSVMKVSQFLGSAKADPMTDFDDSSKHVDQVEQHAVPETILLRKMASAVDDIAANEASTQLKQLIKERADMSATVRDIMGTAAAFSNRIGKGTKMYESKELTLDLMTECYYPVVDAFHSKCYGIGCNDYATKQIGKFADMCKGGYSADSMIKAIDIHCQFENGPICGVY